MLCFRCGSPVDDAARVCENCGQDLASSSVQADGKFDLLQRRMRQSSPDLLRSAQFRPGDLLCDRYETIDVVGSGPLGMVYKALDQELEVEVAVKVIANEHLPNEEARERFLVAMQEAKGIAHDNIVRTLDIDREGARCFVVMQFLEGLTLRKILDLRRSKGQTFTIREVEPIFSQICDGLGHCWSKLPHGGLKPENIVILPDILKITDFGLPLAIPMERYLRAQEASEASLSYLAPEVRKGLACQASSDVYSVAAIIVEMLSGQPYLGGDVDLGDVGPEVPDAFDQVLARALSPEPTERFAHAGLLAHELQIAMLDRPPTKTLSYGVTSDDVKKAIRAIRGDASLDTLRGTAPGAVVAGATQKALDSGPVPLAKSPSQATRKLEMDDLEEVDSGVDSEEAEELLVTTPGMATIPGVAEPKVSSPTEPASAGVPSEGKRPGAVSPSVPAVLANAPDEKGGPTDAVAPHLQPTVKVSEEELLQAKPVTGEHEELFEESDEDEESDDEETDDEETDDEDQERTQRVDARILAAAPEEEEPAEQVFLVSPQAAPSRPVVSLEDGPQVSGVVSSDDDEEEEERVSQPGFAPLGGRIKDRVPGEQEARAREALQAFEFDASLQAAIDSAIRRERAEDVDDEVEEPLIESANAPASEPVVTPPVSRSAVLPEVLHEDAVPEPMTEPLREEKTLNVPRPVAPAKGTALRLGLLIVALLAVIATASVITYINYQRNQDAERERAHKEALALKMAEEQAARELSSGHPGAEAPAPTEEPASPAEAPDSGPPEPPVTPPTAGPGPAAAVSAPASASEKNPSESSKPTNQPNDVKSTERGKTPKSTESTPRAPRETSAPASKAPASRAGTARKSEDRAEPASAKTSPAPVRKPADEPRPTPTKTAAARPEPAPPPAAPEPASSGDGLKCPRGMAHVRVKGSDGFCIDAHEYPGRGKPPQRGVGLDKARSVCQMRGLRLCTVREWMRACGSGFPYGKTYDATRCNTEGNTPQAAGSLGTCRSAVGVFDLSGNVNEWVAEGYAMGGDAKAGEAKSTCRSNARGGELTGFRCCGDPEWE